LKIDLPLFVIIQSYNL